MIAPSSQLASVKKWLDADGKRVTYIAGLRSPEGIVLSADTQETYNDEIVYTEKIELHDCASYKLAIAGAGRGELIDGFILALTQNIRRDDPANGQAVKALIDSCLADFYRNDVRLFPGKQKTIGFLIAATRIDGTELHLWRTKGMRVFDVARKSVIGYRAPFATYVLDRLYKNSLPLTQLVLLSVYLVAIAKDSGVSVGGPTQLVVITHNGIQPENPEYVTSILDRLTEYERRVNQVFLACADTTVSVPELEDSLEQFKQIALRLHREHIDEQAAAITLEQLLEHFPQRRLPKVPIKFSMSGKIAVEHNRQAIENAREKWKKLKILASGWPFNLIVHCQCGTDFKVEIPDAQYLGEKREFRCTKCGHLNVIFGFALEDIGGS